MSEPVPDNFQTCPLCENTASATRRYTKIQSARTLEVIHCKNCGLAFLASIDKSYNDDLYSYYQRRMTWPEDDIFDPLTERRLLELTDKLERICTEKSVLDVGCGKGHFLKVATQRGWRARGIDLAEAGIELCRRFRLPATRVDFFDKSLDEERFGLITMFELIEHVPNPKDFINRAATLLRADGILYITTPNFDCIDRYLLGAEWPAIHVEHVTYFSPKTLRSLIEASGAPFCIEQVETHNVSGQALKRLLRPQAIAPRTSRQLEAPTQFKSSVEASTRSEKRLRGRLEKSSTLRLAKRSVNTVLNRTGTGNALRVVCRRC